MTTAPSGSARTTLLRNGAVYNPAEPYATALLTVGDTVAWIGSEDGADLHADGVDEIVDLDGGLVTPAFVDAHVHATSTGLALTGLDLSGSGSREQVLDRLAAFAANLPADGVVLGTGWDETAWPDAKPPTAEELDRAAGGRAVYLSRVDVHSAVASSVLLAAVPDLETAAGYRGEGLVAQKAHHLIRAAAYGKVTPNQRDDAQRIARARAAELGIGAVHECGGPDISGEDDFTGLLELAADEPGPYVFGYWGELTDPVKAFELGGVGAGGDLFIDGALGSRTAALRDPYADAADTGDPTHGGVTYLDVEQLAGFLAMCVEAEVQPGFHVIGDYAMDLLVGALELAAEAVDENRLRALTVRAEHAEMVDAAAIAKLARFGVVVSAQPGFDEAWGGPSGMYAKRLGAERAAALNPFAALGAAGIVLAFGSDSPVTPLGPWAAVRAAAFHQTPQSRITVRAAFSAHTRGGWRALRPGAPGVPADEQGVLAPGAAATYAVWQAGDLVVQTPDSRVAAWSTDERAGVPGLPDLTPGLPLPQCLRTSVRGWPVYDRLKGR
ncbi:amidohydrolase [Actinospica robiniae]|uniref:amidohydrolase n=1 Tax=Actinospica robiniae TaxID=304901 RepID=UPI0004255ED9|nr:amidohydrolase family protein [Actinospica robiniae]